LPIHHLASAVEQWFRRHQRPLPWRVTYEPYHVWISEVMAQQTRLEVVTAYFARFIETFPTIAALSEASDDEVTAAWSGLGYYRRARMLRDGARDVVMRFTGELPRRVEELTTIAGIGRYTAGAIASIAFEQHAPIVDGNVARVTARLFGIDATAGSPDLLRQAWLRAEELVGAATSPRALNQGLMELGALVCTPRAPACLTCPLARACVTRSDALPRAKAKKVTCELNIPLYVVTDRKGRVLMRREEGPLMNAMFHLPHGNSLLLAGAPMQATKTTPIGSFRHTVTNRRITFEVAHAPRPRHPDPSYQWIDARDLGSLPHPSYVRKALQLAGI
jgi:A/G-specific adenine glycosylase